MVKPVISLVDDANIQCGAGADLFGARWNRVCYAVEPKEEQAIPAGDIILQIFSTVNQLSVTRVGEVEVLTQQWDEADQ